MPEGVEGLDQPCRLDGCDGKPIGEHTLNELWEHNRLAPDVPFEEITDPAASKQAAGVMIAGLPDAKIADTVDVRAAMMGGGSGSIAVSLPILVMDFKQGRPTGPPVAVVTVAFIASAEVMRGFGRLIRDSANAAANKAQPHR